MLGALLTPAFRHTRATEGGGARRGGLTTQCTRTLALRAIAGDFDR